MLTSTHDPVRGPGGRAAGVARQARATRRYDVADHDDADVVVDAAAWLAQHRLGVGAHRSADAATVGAPRPARSAAEVAHAAAACAAGLDRRGGRRFRAARRRT